MGLSISATSLQQALDLTCDLIDLQLLVKRAVDLAEKAASSWVLSYTDFLSPPLVADVKANTEKLAEVEVVAWGGFSQAERCRLCIGNSELMASALANPEEVTFLLRPVINKASESQRGQGLRCEC